MIEAVQLGTIDPVSTSTGPLGNLVPETKILDGKIGQDIPAKFPAKGLIGLTWGENGFRHTTNNNVEIKTPAVTVEAAKAGTAA